MNPNSPNALWAKHGFTIERQQRRAGGPKIRTIRNQAGEVVLHDAGYDAEMDWINDNLEPHHQTLPTLRLPAPTPVLVDEPQAVR